MSRTTDTAVKAILGILYNTETNPSLTAFIDSASVMVDNAVSCATLNGVTITDASLERMEAYLAAHLYGLQDQFLSEERTGKAAGKYQGMTGKGLDATTYGQMAKRFDPSGCLSQADEGVSLVSLNWLGKPPSEQIDYLDRD